MEKQNIFKILILMVLFHLGESCPSRSSVIRVSNGIDGISIIGSYDDNIEDIDHDIIIDPNEINFINQRQKTSRGNYR